MSFSGRRIAAALAIVLLTLAAFVAVTFRFRLEPNIAALLPERGEAAALRRYVNGFGGGDLAVIFVESGDADESAAVAAEIARELAKKPSVKVAADRIDASRSLDPMLAFRHADPRAMARLEKALTPEGMRSRLAES
ncbi:MAG: hypothetical protein L6Q76_11485, partial [Polyangiaceae bacterium]|nr:hypothetical protein [Polyangiaceae bacterium]